jgi:glycosyltransferase involved in cell wall biosynthesis
MSINGVSRQDAKNAKNAVGDQAFFASSAPSRDTLPLSLPVSVVMIAKDEEQNIEAALASVEGAVEVVVIVDEESADATFEICRRFTQRVYQRPWTGYALQKQAAIDLAAGPWVFLLDADERVTPELAGEIKNVVERHLAGEDGDVSGYYAARRNYFLGKWIRHGGWWPDYTVRLFRKDQARIEPRRVHERVVVDGKTGYLKHPFEHYTYRSLAEFEKKMQRYSTLSAEEFFIKRPQRVGIFSIVVRPVAAFLKMYILRGGFLDGIHGLILASLYACNTFLKYAKAWEKRAG